jgi:glycosyltransferase involved in cell wall biosynthesis
MLVGGPDVDARIELMRELDGDFRLVAVGTAPELQSHFQEAGFAYENYPLKRRVNPPADLRTLVSLTCLFRRHRPDIVHSFDTKPCALARLAARFAGVPVVVGTLPGLGSLYVNDGIATRATRFIYEWLQRIACHRADLTIFQNHEDAREFLDRGIVPAGRSTVVPGSGVNTDFFDPTKISKPERDQVRTELRVHSDALLITMVSRLIRSKGVLEFAAAAEQVHELHPEVKFLIVGPEDNESLDRLTSSELAQITQFVTWTGVRNDICAVLAASDIFVLPSFLREGIPRVLLEAASLGLPIVTTDSPGCNEVVEHGVNGFLVPIRDQAALAQAIVRLVENPEMRRRFGQASRQRAVAHFDLSRIASQIRSIYRQLLAQKGLLPIAPEG